MCMYCTVCTCRGSLPYVYQISDPLYHCKTLCTPEYVVILQDAGLKADRLNKRRISCEGIPSLWMCRICIVQNIGSSFVYIYIYIYTMQLMYCMQLRVYRSPSIESGMYVTWRPWCIHLKSLVNKRFFLSVFMCYATTLIMYRPTMNTKFNLLETLVLRNSKKFTFLNAHIYNSLPYCPCIPSPACQVMDNSTCALAQTLRPFKCALLLFYTLLLP